jgi:LCP family protein required for cell wall assembly
MKRDSGQVGGSEPAPKRRLGLRRPGTAGTGDISSRTRRSATRKVFAWVAVCLVAALTAGALTAYVRYRDVWHSINRVHVTGLGKRPPRYTDALNILVIGSDSRSGKNKKFGAGVAGQRSDTVMLLHLSPGRRRAIVVSLPRDSVMPILGCRPEPGFAGQHAQPGGIEQLNATFAIGGPGCLWKTVEHTTGIHIDHFIELNFTGFEKVINDIGGVNICLPWAIHDPLSKLHMRKGMHHVMGAQALAFWRVRYIGEGSDLQRIRRDQYLMASLVQGVKRSGLLNSPAKIYSVVTDAASAMTTDSGLNLDTMIKIVESLRSLPPRSVQFIEAPTAPYPPDPNWVEWPKPRAPRLFRAIAHDRRLPSARQHQATGTTPTLESIPTSKVHVKVLNGSGVAGIATQAAASLASRGFRVAGTGDAPSFRHLNSVIDYPSAAALPAARTLQAQLSHVVLRKDAAVPLGTVDLILGARYTGLVNAAATSSPSSSASPTASAPGSAPVGELAKNYGGINANTNVCHDTRAFAGPDGHS